MPTIPFIMDVSVAQRPASGQPSDESRLSSRQEKQLLLIRLYANVYYTTDDVLANHGDVLVRFLTGSAGGWGHARENPEAAVDHLVSEYRNLSRASELEAVGAVLGFSFDDTTAKDGWAAMNPANRQAQTDT